MSFLFQFNVYIEVPESDCSLNDDDDDEDGQFVSPFPLPLETRTFGIRRLSRVDASSYQSEGSIRKSKQTLDFPATNETYLSKSYSTNITSLSIRSDSSCMIVDVPESNYEDPRVNEISVDEPVILYEEASIDDVVINASGDLRSGMANGLPIIAANNNISGLGTVDGPQKSSKRRYRSHVVDEKQQTSDYDDNGALNLSTRRRINCSQNDDGKTANTSNRSAISCVLDLSLKTDDRKISAASSKQPTNHVVRNYSPKMPTRTNYKQNQASEISPAKNASTKREEFVVHPTQTIAQNDVRVLPNDEMEIKEQRYPPKRVEGTLSNRTVAVNSQNRALQPNEQKRYLLENQNHSNLKERGTVVDHSHSIKEPKNDNREPSPLHSRCIIHPTQIIRRIKPLPSPNKTYSVIQIEDVDSDEENTAVQAVDRNKSAVSSTAMDRSTPKLVRPDLHTTPTKMDEIHKKNEAINWRSLESSKEKRAQSSPSFDFDAIESCDPPIISTERVKQKSLIIALPKRARKNVTPSIDRTDPFVPSPSKVAKAPSHQQDNPCSFVDLIYDVPTQELSKNNKAKYPDTVTTGGDDIISLLDDDDEPEVPVFVDPPKPRKKASTVRSRTKAAPKTVRNTKKSPANHVSFVFEAPKMKRRQSRRKVVKNLGSLSPCSEMGSMAKLGNGASKKRKLFNRDAALDEIEPIDDGDDVLSVKPKRSKTMEFDELLETTVSTAADLDATRKNNPKKFFNRVTENMNKISSQVKTTPLSPTKMTPIPAVDPFDALKEDSMNLKNSMGKVTYSYRTSKKTKSQTKNSRISSTKTSTCKTSVICIRN